MAGRRNYPGQAVSEKMAVLSRGPFTLGRTTGYPGTGEVRQGKPIRLSGETMAKIIIAGIRYQLSWARDSKGNLRPSLPLEAALTPEGKAILRMAGQGLEAKLPRPADTITLDGDLVKFLARKRDR